jgi:hypothetical protein
MAGEESTVTAQVVDTSLVDAAAAGGAVGAAAVAPANPAAPAAGPSAEDLGKLVDARIAEALSVQETTEVEAPAASSDEGAAASDAEKLYTKEDLEKHGKVQANRTMQRFADYGELKAQVDKLKDLPTQLETATSELTATTAERDALATKALRLEIALDKKLPKELAVRLQGNTPEEITADADSLLSVAGGAVHNGFGGGVQSAGPPPGGNFNDEIRKRAGFGGE